jgi:hypothetical protein
MINLHIDLVQDQKKSAPAHTLILYHYIPKIILVRQSQLFFEILAYSNITKLRESRKKVENNGQVISSI